jgi:hypothetical protein
LLPSAGRFTSDTTLFSQVNKLPRELLEKRIGAKEFPLLSGPDAPPENIHPTLWAKAVLKEEPHPIQAQITSARNGIVGDQNTGVIEEAFRKLDFMVTMILVSCLRNTFLNLDCFREPGAARWACQNEAPVSPWPTGHLPYGVDGSQFCYVLTSPCPKGARSSVEAKGWMRCAAFPADFAPLQRGHRSAPPLHVELFYVIFETQY